MTCNLCGFSVPSPDHVSIALMQQHLWQEHDIERYRPVPAWQPPERDYDDPTA
jgi:hypothetical protein